MANTTTTNTTTQTQEAQTNTTSTVDPSQLTPEMLQQMAEAMGSQAPVNPGAFFCGIQYTANQLGDDGLVFPDGRRYSVQQILNGIAYASDLAEKGIPEVKGWHNWPLWKKILVGAGIVGGVGFLGYLVYDKYFTSGSSEIYVDTNGDEFEIVDC